MKIYRITETGYRYDKRIFITIMGIFLLFIFYIMYINSFDFSTHPYLECKDNTCKNPFYDMLECKQTLNILWIIPIYQTEDCKVKCDWCNEPILRKGIYGEKPKGENLLNNAGMFGIILIFLGLILNHLINNKGKKFDIEIPITEKLIINRRKIKEWINKYDKEN